MEKQTIVIALGGNAILQPGQTGTFQTQMENIERSMKSIGSLINEGHRVAIVHGNGPQVGQILQQNELASPVIPEQPLAACSAESQGYIGYMIQESFKNLFPTIEAATLVTLTEVDPSDEAFHNPTKPIGTFYSEEQAHELRKEKGWNMQEDAGRGYRRVVASPAPIRILETPIIKKLLNQDIVVVSTGGGGIPVVKNEQGNYLGVAAVVDKDLSALQLSKDIEADKLMILTDVSNVYINYGKPEQQKLEAITVEQAQKYMDEGQFSKGSMAPKMAAAIDFSKQGKTAIICSLEDAFAALKGEAGTRVIGV